MRTSLRVYLLSTTQCIVCIEALDVYVGKISIIFYISYENCPKNVIYWFISRFGCRFGWISKQSK